MLAVLAGGCVSERVPTSLDDNPRYYFNPEFPPGDVSNRDGQEIGGAVQNSPAAGDIGASSMRSGEAHKGW